MKLREIRQVWTEMFASSGDRSKRFWHSPKGVFAFSKPAYRETSPALACLSEMGP